MCIAREIHGDVFGLTILAVSSSWDQRGTVIGIQIYSCNFSIAKVLILLVGVMGVMLRQRILTNTLAQLI